MKNCGNNLVTAFCTLLFVLALSIFTGCETETDDPPLPDTGIYSIALDVSDGTHTFQARSIDYTEAPPALTVTVANTGDRPTGNLTVSLLGAGAGAFTLSVTSISSIAVGDDSSFTVQPKGALAAGEHTAVVTVSGDNDISESFTVIFNVDAVPTPRLTASVSSLAFEERRFGEDRPDAQTITLTNNGTGTATIAAGGITLGGANEDSFNLDSTGPMTIAVEAYQSFTVQPNEDLNQGTYTAAITVSYDGGGPITINISFTVYRAQVAQPALDQDAFPFNGTEHTVTLAEPVSGAYILDGTTSATAAGTYTATVTLTDNFEWTDGTREPLELQWSVGSVPPGEVASFTATAGNAQVELTWTAPENTGGSAITEYQVSRDNWTNTVTLDANARTYTFTDLTNGTEYTFRIRAVNTAGPGTERTQTATPRALPGQVASFTVTPGDTEVVLLWTEPGDTGGSAITAYQLSRDNWINTVTLDANARTHTFTGLTNGTEYTFRVRAVNEAGEGAERTQTATPRSVPGQVASFTVTPGDTQVVLIWTEPGNTGGSAITEYQVTRDNWTNIETLDANTRTYTFTGLTNGTEYTFRVRAVNEAGTGDERLVSAVPRTTPGAVGSLTATAGPARVDLSWTAPANDGGAEISGYRVSRDNGANWTSVTGNTHTVTGLTNGQQYTFIVHAVNAAGDGEHSQTQATPNNIYLIRGGTGAPTFDFTTTVAGQTLPQPGNLQSLIDSIRTHANTADVILEFTGANSALTVNQGITFENATPAWGAITLRGHIITTERINVLGNVSITNTATISGSPAIYHNSTGTLTINGGVITGSTAHPAIRIVNAGLVRITGNADVRSAVTTASIDNGTIVLDHANARLLIEENARVENRAVLNYNNGAYAIAILNLSSVLDDAVEITGGAVHSASGTAIMNTAGGRINISGTAQISSSGNTVTRSTISLIQEARLYMSGGRVVRTDNTASPFFDFAIANGSSNNNAIVISGGTVEIGNSSAINITGSGRTLIRGTAHIKSAGTSEPTIRMPNPTNRGRLEIESGIVENTGGGQAIGIIAGDHDIIINEDDPPLPEIRPPFEQP